jgi:hypothetical protein
MILLKSYNEMDKIIHLDEQVKNSIAEDLQILDDNYGADRKMSDWGGFVAIIESVDDVEILDSLYYLNINEDIPEYVDNLHRYIKKLFIAGSEFAIAVYIPKG